jgi:hypothetical protein
MQFQKIFIPSSQCGIGRDSTNSTLWTVCHRSFYKAQRELSVVDLLRNFQKNSNETTGACKANLNANVCHIK